MSQVPIVCLDIRTQCTRIAILRANTLNDIDVRRGHRHIVATGNPVLRAGVAESNSRRWQLGHKVLGVRNSPDTTLVRDIRSQCLVAHTWLAVGIL
jgi:hypothetical protein